MLLSLSLFDSLYLSLCLFLSVCCSVLLSFSLPLSLLIFFSRISSEAIWCVGKRHEGTLDPGLSVGRRGRFNKKVWQQLSTIFLWWHQFLFMDLGKSVLPGVGQGLV